MTLKKVKIFNLNLVNSNILESSHFRILYTIRTVRGENSKQNVNFRLKLQYPRLIRILNTKLKYNKSSQKNL